MRLRGVGSLAEQKPSERKSLTARRAVAAGRHSPSQQFSRHILVHLFVMDVIYMKWGCRHAPFLPFRDLNPLRAASCLKTRSAFEDQTYCHIPKRSGHWSEAAVWYPLHTLRRGIIWTGLASWGIRRSSPSTDRSTWYLSNAASAREPGRCFVISRGCSI